MTALTVSPAPTAASTNHLRRAVGIQTVFGRISFLLPWAVLSTSLLINIAIYGLTDDSAHPNRVTGGLASLYGTQLWGYIVTVVQIFPFAVQMSTSRRSMVTAMSGLVLAQSLVNGALLTGLKTLENATGGFGVHVRFFNLPFIEQDDPLTQTLVYAAPLAFLCIAGAAIGAVYLRWGQIGIWSMAIGILLAAGGTVVLILLFHLGSDVASFFSGQPAFALLAVYPAIAATGVALLTGRVLMRARV